jgi:hypothetical protein
MARLKWLLIAGFCSLIVPLQSQTNDWNVVEKLAPGTAISVVERKRHDGRLLKVTSEALDCACWTGDVNRELVFTRQQIREVRLEKPESDQAMKGALIGGAAGLLVGFLSEIRSTDPEARVYAPRFGILVGASLGGGIGKGLHQHGRVIYRRR